jgi:hypothetical protein
MRFALTVLAIVLGEILGIYTAHLLAAPPVATITVEHGPMLPSGATARLRVAIDPRAENRGVWVAIEASGYAAAHYEDLNGANAPRTRWVEFKDLPDGSYTAWVRVIRQHGESSVNAEFTVGAADEEYP